MTQVLTMHRTQPPKHSLPEVKGHEKILASCKKNERLMRFELLNGCIQDGTITQFDRWTITIRDSSGDRRTVFKHALASFHAIH